MDTGAHKILESVTQRSLHAHAFSRASSQASFVLTDLLSRYLTLLASTCAKYSQHSGRTSLVIQDVLASLEELGVSVDELSEYCGSEGKEMKRYGEQSNRRREDLLEFKAQLTDGLRQDRDDAIPLVYMRNPGVSLDESIGDESSEAEEEEEVEEEEEDFASSRQPNDMDIDMPPRRATTPMRRKQPPARISSPPLPLSPISNPSSPPSRKRARTAGWEPPSYIPDFLPPFPMTATCSSPSSQHPPTLEATQLIHLPLSRVEEINEAPPISVSQPMTSSAASDYFVQLPYSQSSLSSLPERHLPQLPLSPPLSTTRSSKLFTPQIEPSLLGAYHHILTHPPPPTPPPSNPSRHKVAMGLLAGIQTASRWDPADTLYSNVSPCPPRVALIGPTYPVPEPPLPETKSKTEKDAKFPVTQPRPLPSYDQLSILTSQQPSRIPELSRTVLPPTIYTRISRLSHPSVLYRADKPLVYGRGIYAPWNSIEPARKDKEKADGVPNMPPAAKPKDNGNDSTPKAVIPDAKLYATWDYDVKDFRVPLPTFARNRPRIGSIQVGGSGGMTLPANPRMKSAK